MKWITFGGTLSRAHRITAVKGILFTDSQALGGIERSSLLWVSRRWLDDLTRFLFALWEFGTPITAVWSAPTSVN
jgi:hypothetical protein